MIERCFSNLCVIFVPFMRMSFGANFGLGRNTNFLRNNQAQIGGVQPCGDWQWVGGNGASVHYRMVGLDRFEPVNNQQMSNPSGPPQFPSISSNGLYEARFHTPVNIMPPPSILNGTSAVLDSPFRRTSVSIPSASQHQAQGSVFGRGVIPSDVHLQLMPPCEASQQGQNAPIAIPDENVPDPVKSIKNSA